MSFVNKKGQPNTRRFLFSSWTLKEGWHTQTRFTIAKLRSSGSENSKLQEVGRGLRLPVDEYGNRVKDESFYLNYIEEFTERDFADRLVMEINEDIQTGRVSHTYPLKICEELQHCVEREKWICSWNCIRKNMFLTWIAHLHPTKVMDLFTEYPEFNNVTGKVKDRNKGTKDVVKIRKARYEELKRTVGETQP